MLIPKIWIDMEVKNSNGEIIQKTSEEGHSWVRNFYNLHSMLMADSPIFSSEGLDLYDTGNIRRTGYIRHTCGAAANQYGFVCQIGEGHGIRLGTGSEPFDIDDYRGSSVIGHGSGAGQLHHYNTTREYISLIDNNPRTKWQVSAIYKRLFSNNSGSPITVTNVCLYLKSNYFGSSGVILMMTKDVLSSSTIIPHGALVTVTYTITSPNILNVTQEPLYSMGTAGSGGYFFSRPGGLRTHLKYVLILAPVNGGLSTALKWSSNTSNTIGATDEYYGYDNTQKLIAQGATSPIGQFVANANANKLGGYDDWYIPARYEYYGVATSFNPVAPAGEETPTGISLWSSTESSTAGAYRFDVNTNSGSATSNKNSNTYQVRLVRRILHRSFIPKIEE